MSSVNQIVIVQDNHSYKTALERFKDSQVEIFKNKSPKELEQLRQDYLNKGFSCFVFSSTRSNAPPFRNLVGEFNPTRKNLYKS